MTEGPDGSDTGTGQGPRDATGTPAEELGRLVAGAQDWLRQNFELAGDAAGGRADGHDATVCGWCPLCQFVAVLRGDRPEVSEKVAQAGAAVASALRAVLDATAERAGRPAGGAEGEPPRVQKIDLGGPGPAAPPPAPDPDPGSAPDPGAGR